MPRVYSHPDPAVAHLVRGALDNAGIAAHVQGEGLGAAMGEIPPIAAWAEVWILDPARTEEAVAIVAESIPRDDEAAAPEWTCPTCGETVEGQFASCWQCGSPAPEA